MTETLTESFCERCGTRYTFESARPRVRLKGVKVLSRGLKNFVLSDDSSMDEAMAAARSETERELTTHQLDAFHATFNFCMSCRQYTCPNCWNELEARCLSCAPLVGQEVLQAPFPDIPATAVLIADAVSSNGNGSNGTASDEDGAPDDDFDFAARLRALTRDAAADDTTTVEVESDIAAGDPVGTVSVAATEPIAADVPDGVAPLVADLTSEPEDRPATPAWLAALAAGSAVAGAKPKGPSPSDSVEDKTAAQTGGLLKRFRPAQTTETETAPVAQEDVAAAESAAEISAAARAAAEIEATEREAAQIEAAAQAAAELEAAQAEAELMAAAQGEASAQAEAAAQAEATRQAELEAAREADGAARAARAAAAAQAAAELQAAARAEAVRQGELEAAAQAETAKQAEAARQADLATAAQAEAARQTEAEAARVAADIEAAAAAAAAAEAAATAEDIVRQPTWQMVAPDTNNETPLGRPGDPAIVMPPAASAIDPNAEPQWPSRPDGVLGGLPFLNRPPTPEGGLEALWAESNREVVSTPLIPGKSVTGAVQPCLSCGLSLSANARFCRRCGTPQAS